MKLVFSVLTLSLFLLLAGGIAPVDANVDGDDGPFQAVWRIDQSSGSQTVPIFAPGRSSPISDAVVMQLPPPPIALVPRPGTGSPSDTSPLALIPDAKALDRLETAVSKFTEQLKQGVVITHTGTSGMSQSLSQVSTPLSLLAWLGAILGSSSLAEKLYRLGALVASGLRSLSPVSPQAGDLQSQVQTLTKYLDELRAVNREVRSSAQSPNLS